MRNERTNLFKIFYDAEDDYFGYSASYEALKKIEVDRLYNLLGEVLCVLDDVYDEIGDRRHA